MTTPSQGVLDVEVAGAVVAVPPEPHIRHGAHRETKLRVRDACLKALRASIESELVD